ncbi:hypothetical protein BHAOGJBA_5119 [Methylobacterium hispanicum]|uniref:Uncharacterized protein n=1 Tax=Methylobacterium hispanicum TaxID=270350 RepID=A0AAV4ZUP3_9HYPH|nr:hypothetical protein [Methylobacterium hispanicum]GJD91571.1 hypothetical protein BHAOGJBA_5119 [Methylobacterium hispanicum]
MSDIETYIEAAEARGRGSRAELEALRAIVGTIGGLLGEAERAAVAMDPRVEDKLEFNLDEGQSGLDRSDPETWLLAARQHGADEDPDHEFGDLQDLARAAWERMGSADVARFGATATARDLVPAAAAPTA